MSERVLEDFAPGELTCRQLAELVSDHIEGVLDPKLQRRIAEHLADCEDCTTYVEQMRTTIAVAGETASGDVTPAVRGALLELFLGWADGTNGSQRPR
jgi:anti-sigma factor RsiW